MTALKKQRKFSAWVRHLRTHPPYLDFWLDIGLLRIRTELMNERCENRTRVYISLEIKILRKWGWRFRLYSLVN